MNFPNATAADWTDARRYLMACMRRDCLDHDTADEVAQALTVRILTGRIPAEYRSRKTGEVVAITRPIQAAAGLARLASRLGAKIGSPAAGWRAMLPWKDRRKAGEPLPVADRSSRSLDPAFMAARAEAMQERTGEGFAPVALARVQEAAGVGPLAMHEAGTTPHIHGTGPGHTPPAEGWHGYHTETDPRPTWHRYQPQPLTGDALDRYREALAEHYASR